MFFFYEVFDVFKSVCSLSHGYIVPYISSFCKNIHTIIIMSPQKKLTFEEKILKSLSPLNTKKVIVACSG